MKKSLVRRIREIAEDEFKNAAEKLDKEQKFSSDIIEKVDKEIIHSLMSAGVTPFERDSPTVEAEIYFHATKFCANIRNYFLVTCGMVGSTILKFGTDLQKFDFQRSVELNRSFLASLAITEINGGSDHKAVTTRYAQVDGGYRIDGKKCWITLGGIADLYLVAANGDYGIGLFVVLADHPGVSRSEHMGLVCSRGSHLSSVTFDNVVVGSGAVLGGGFSESREALNYALNVGRAISSISGVGLASVALDGLVKYSRQRRQFGARICDHQLIQGLIAECATEIAAAKLMSIWAFKALRSNRQSVSSICAMAKFKSAAVTQRVTEVAMQAVGAIGISEEMPLERYFREARAFHYIEGTSQILQQLIARQRLVGIPNLWESHE